MANEDPTNEHPVGMTGRGLRRRRFARFLLAIAIVLPAILGALVLMAPATSGPIFVEPPDLTITGTILVLGILAYVVGLAWMVRIYRADPEAHASFWRSRRY